MIPFTKVHGLGNDFVLIDKIASPELALGPLDAFARRVNDRRRSVGGDGLIVIEPSSQADLRMSMINPDGTEGNMCGNGLRCVAKLAVERGYVPSEAWMTIDIGERFVKASCHSNSFSVDMGLYSLEAGKIGLDPSLPSPFLNQDIEGFQCSAIFMGNPHLVIFSDVSDQRLLALGPHFEHDARFTARTNVNFLGLQNRSRITLKTWERGAGRTLACGSGACAAVVAASLANLTEPSVEVQMAAGMLHIEVKPDRSVIMTGPAECVFDGFLG